MVIDARRARLERIAAKNGNKHARSQRTAPYDAPACVGGIQPYTCLIDVAGHSCVTIPLRTLSLAFFNTKPMMMNGIPMIRNVRMTHFGVKIGCQACAEEEKTTVTGTVGARRVAACVDVASSAAARDAPSAAVGRNQSLQAMKLDVDRCKIPHSVQRFLLARDILTDWPLVGRHRSRGSLLERPHPSLSGLPPARQQKNR